MVPSLAYLSGCLLYITHVGYLRDARTWSWGELTGF